MKSMSDEIASVETVKAVEDSLRKSIQEQMRMTISRIRVLRNLAIGLAVVNALLTVVLIVTVLH